MPQATDLAIKNNAGVSKTFALAAPASGVMPAVWLLREGANQSVFPKVEMSSRKNGAGDARKVQTTFTLPVAVVDASGITRRAAAFSVNIDVTVPDLVSDAARDDAIAYVADLVGHTLYKSCVRVGFAPT